MSWHCLPELAAGSSGGSSAVSALSAPWKKSRTVERCSSDASATVCYPCSRSGTTSEPSTVNRGVESWISSLLDSRVSRSASPGSDKGPTTSGTCGPRPSVSFAKYDPSTSSWRTFPDLFPVDISDESSGIWPKRGSIQSGVAFLLPRWERPTSGSVSWSSPHQAEFPTPTVADSKNLDNPSRLRRASPELGNVVGGTLNPRWVEWLMGWAIGWVSLEPLETDRFHEWLRKHGIG